MTGQGGVPTMSVAAFAGLDVLHRLSFPREEAEIALIDENVDAKGTAGELLAIGAVAERDLLGVDVSLELDCAAVAGTIDLHAMNLSPEGRRDSSAYLRSSMRIRQKLIRRDISDEFFFLFLPRLGVFAETA